MSGLFKFYDNLDSGMKQCKQSELIVIMWDFNAKVGNRSEDQVVRGLGKHNDRWDILVWWAKSHNQSLAVPCTRSTQEGFIYGTDI